MEYKGSNEYVRKDDDEWNKVVKPPADNRVKTEDVTNTRGLDWDEMVLRKEV